MYRRVLSLIMVVTASAMFVGCSNNGVSKGTEYVAEEANESADSGSGVSTETVETATYETSVEASAAESVSEIIEEDTSDDNNEAEDNAIDIVFVGDSQYANGRDAHTDIATYVAWMVENSNVYNVGIGGSTASITNSESYIAGETISNTFVNVANVIAGNAGADTISDETVASSISNINAANVDYYVIEYGYNDYMSKSLQSDEESAYDNHLYVDALCQGIDTLAAASPNAKFIVCSPSYCLVYDNSGKYLGDGNITDFGYGTLADYVNSCEGAANAKGAIYIDMYYGTEMDINSYTVDDYTEDGLHLCQKGRYMYATVVAHYINKNLGIDNEELNTLIFNKFEYDG